MCNIIKPITQPINDNGRYINDICMQCIEYWTA